MQAAHNTLDMRLQEPMRSGTECYLTLRIGFPASEVFARCGKADFGSLGLEERVPASILRLPRPSRIPFICGSSPKAGVRPPRRIRARRYARGIRQTDVTTAARGDKRPQVEAHCFLDRASRARSSNCRSADSRLSNLRRVQAEWHSARKPPLPAGGLVEIDRNTAATAAP